ncbi:unnamed protein product [Caenorhabditis angaria]|uniref:SGS domain-containing protein n=1 Tax=Caenorhabditis angaria TaxID=860376 RepID=A0A9P1IUQ0_9PELO|nr:unnamed protein product [Caenorhabditis angaria]
MADKKPRFDWFQSDLDVVLTILKKNVVLEKCTIHFNDGHLTVKDDGNVLFEEDLFSDVKHSDFIVQCTPSKVEVKMPKGNRGERWATLTKTSGTTPIISSPLSTVQQQQQTVPSVSFAKKNWDAIEKQALQEEEDESQEGDAAVNKMFQKIYRDASDDVKKAMMKSYQESGGTVLSTNWADIGSRKVDVQPPDCMEYKKFDS